MSVLVLFFLIFLVVITALVVLIVVLAVRNKRKRQLALWRAVTAMGWYYEARNDGYRGRFYGTPFNHTKYAHVDDVITGTYRGRSIFACDYTYTESNGESQSTYHYTVVSVQTPAQRPTLQVTREGAMSGLLDKFGVRDLQLESQQFNDAYHIKTSDNRFAYDILHPRMMEFLLADQRAWRWPFRFERADLVSWESGKPDMNKVVWMLDFVSDIADRVPSHVWSP